MSEGQARLALENQVEASLLDLMLKEDGVPHFVHSFHVVCKKNEDVLAVTEYGYPFASIVQRENIMGAQFHPEKSHRFGMSLLRNFAGMA